MPPKKLAKKLSKESISRNHEESNVKKQKQRLKCPKNRKRLIRDLPREAAVILHPALRRVLTCRQKRWNSGSPQHRIAVNLVKRYKRRLIPRVMPFFCDKCRLNSRSIKTIRSHYCEPVLQRKANRLEYQRRFVDYDCSTQIKHAQNPEKQWRFNSMACLEQSLWPEKVFQRTEMNKELEEDQFVERSCDEQALNAQQDEYEDPVEHYKLSDVLVPATLKLPETTMKEDRNSPGVFCFHCKESYQSFNQYQLHLHKTFNDGKCSDKLPSYHYTQKFDKTGTISDKLRHSIVRHRPMKRDVSHVQCTLCKRGNFSGTEELFTHMKECAKANKETESTSSGPPTRSHVNSGQEQVKQDIVKFDPSQFS